MATVKIRDLPYITSLQSNTANTVLVGVDVPGDFTGQMTLTTLASGLFSNNFLRVGNNDILLANAVGQFTGNAEPYLQVALRNNDANGSGDFVVTSDTGTDSTHYIDVGIQGSNLSQGVLLPSDGYLIVVGDGTNPGGNLIVGTDTPDRNVDIILGGHESNNVVAQFLYGEGFKLTQKPLIFADGTSQNSAVAYTGVDSRITANVNTINGSITSNVVTINGSIDSNVATINGSITANAASANSVINTNISANVATLRGEITANAASANSVINTNISANVATLRGEITSNVNTINSSITANAVSANSVINTNISANVATLRSEITANAESANSVINSRITANIATANLFTQAAFDKANNALANTTGTFAGSLTITNSLNTGGFITFANSGISSAQALVTISASNTGVTQTPGGDGYVLFMTGKHNVPTRIVADSFGANGQLVFPLFGGRAARGNVTNPTAVQTNDVLTRVGASGFGATTYQTGGTARIDFIATENHTDSARGTAIKFYNVANGSNVVNQIAAFNANTVEFIGTVNPQKGFIYTPRILTGAQTAITIDFANDSMIRAEFNSTLTISFANYTYGKVVECWVTNTAGNGQTINLGALANNTTTGSSTLSVAAGRSAKLQYFSIDGDLPNTFLAITYA